MIEWDASEHIRVKNILQFIDKRPRVVATLLGPGDLISQARKSKKDGADILEVRIDSLSPKERRSIVPTLKKIKAASRLPIIATVRDPQEQGPSGLFQRIETEERLDLYSKALPLSELADVELKSPIAPAVLRMAKKSNAKVILSSHDFSGAPQKGDIKKMHLKFKKLKGDILKITAAPRDRRDVLSYMQHCLTLRSTRRVFIAMGELGKISRLAGFCFGSCLTYGFVKRSAAPGQVPVRDLAQIYKHLRAAR